MGLRVLFFSFLIVLFVQTAQAQVRGLPKLPTSGSLGLQGSVGLGFADFTVLNPEDDFKIDRGNFVAATIERGFDFMHLYLTLGLSYMSTEGLANYSYQNLSSSTTYSVSDIKFRSTITDLNLGLKIKLIDDYWFRPYIEAGGLGGYHEITYTSKKSALAAIGSDYKEKEAVISSGYYYEGGIEAMFSEKFGVKLGARESNYQTKNLETLGNRRLTYKSETYYLSLLFGF